MSLDLVFGPAQFWGITLGYAVLLFIAAVLLLVLARLVPDTPGPRWWGGGALLALAGALIASSQAQAHGPWARAVYVLGDSVLLLGICMVSQGLRRFCGAPPGARWLAVAVLVQLVLGGALELYGMSRQHTVVVSAMSAGAWLSISWTALKQLRGPGAPIYLGLALCGVLGATGWLWRCALLASSGNSPLPAVVVHANTVLIAFAFVATGAQVLLYVLLVNFRLAARLRQLAVRDPLTGALNRRGFEEHTARLTALSTQLGQSVAVLMLDIDHFKQVNDNHGHHAGDLVLRALAHLVQRAKRETDVFARLGGEEFCLVLPGTDVPGARVFADRLRRSFETLEIDTGRSFLSCTMSVGVAYASAQALQSGRSDVVDLLRQADDALYEAKRAGRNRVRFWASDDVVSSRIDSRLFASTTG
ncbi:GGDEF domain-containing protein [Aquabacterium sp. A7-Y]|uniref:GGDEF domain-containing protein n=1 Tax=Aquabacterium sp. A7-Y TaxID=1349605 RepID=UPI00223D7666|nr:GGDEF domain-containing protein [Aquabacterium sp. A7-Y]MCW7539155.1 GGDEF domain-containing protein [Aquabacterium sp. A7-Y]